MAGTCLTILTMSLHKWASHLSPPPHNQTEKMATIPPSPCFLASDQSVRPTPAHLVAVASSLGLGHHLRLRCVSGLRHSLLSSPFLEGYFSDYFFRMKDIWCHRPCLLKRCVLLETLGDSFSASCSPFFSFFSGKESQNGFMGKGKTSEGSSSNRRLWTNVLLAINVMVYVAQVASQGKLLLWGAKVNSLIDNGQSWRFLTASLLHANFGHLMVNCFSLDSIGPTVEQLSGPGRFLSIYFMSAIASSVMSYRFCHSPAVGASGAIFGLVGSYTVFILRHKKFFRGGKQDIQHIARVIAINMVIGLLSTGIDNWGHLGGLLGGAAMSWFLGPAWRFVLRTDDGRLVYADKAPIFHFINRRLF